MFKKILIAEDLESINYGLTSMLKKEYPEITILNDRYCDGAYAKIQKGLLDGEPFDLLITDLSFSKDHITQKTAGGAGLVEKSRKKQPNLKIIVYSIENRPSKVNMLFDRFGINGYVLKHRNGLVELKDAINEVCKNRRYVSEAINIRKGNHIRLNDFDILILGLLCNGLSQEQISMKLKEDRMKPNSLSTVEKRFNRLKDSFKANNLIHLVSIIKDLGVV